MTNNSKERKGLILAAGYGSRLNGLNAATSFKPLTPIAGKPLIFRTIDSLTKAGCTSIVIVLGHGYDTVKDAILEFYTGSLKLEFVYNDKYELSNGVSVLAAIDHLGEEFIMTMADHILDDSLMTLAKNYDVKADHVALLVDYKLDSIFDMEDATKVYAEDNKVVSIGKEITSFNCIDTGVFICTKALLEALDIHFKSHGDVSISNGVQYLANKGRMLVVDVGEGYWQDVDTPGMYEAAEKYLQANRKDKG